MKFAYFSLAAILAALVLGASLSLPASAATDLHASAVHACTIANASQPVDFVAEVDDGRGGSRYGSPMPTPISGSATPTPTRTSSPIAR